MSLPHLQSGMDYGRSFDMAATLLENDEETKQKLMNCKEKMFEGESFSKVIRETEIYFPTSVKDDHDCRKNGRGQIRHFLKLQYRLMVK